MIRDSLAVKIPFKEVIYDFERKIWTNLSNSSVPTTEWFYNNGRHSSTVDRRPYPILNDILAITLQDNFNANPFTSFTIQSSNFCSVHKQNGLSCTAEHGPGQGLGKAKVLGWLYRYFRIF